MTKNQMIAIGVGVVGALFLFGGAADAGKPPAPPPKGGVSGRNAKLGGFLSSVGIVFSERTNPDGSVTMTEQNFWAGTPPITVTLSAQEYAARDAAINDALNRGISESPLYSLDMYRSA